MQIHHQNWYYTAATHCSCYWQVETQSTKVSALLSLDIWDLQNYCLETLFKGLCESINDLKSSVNLCQIWSRCSLQLKNKIFLNNKLNNNYHYYCVISIICNITTVDNSMAISWAYTAACFQHHGITILKAIGITMNIKQLRFQIHRYRLAVVRLWLEY